MALHCLGPFISVYEEGIWGGHLQITIYITECLVDDQRFLKPEDGDWGAYLIINILCPNDYFWDSWLF